MEYWPTYVVVEHDTGETFWIPEELVDIVVTDDLVVVFLPAHELVIYHLISLCSHEFIKWLDDGLEIQAFFDWFHAILTFGAAVIVVGTLENEAQTLWCEADITRLTPAEEIKGDLTKTVVLTHVVHGVSPAI